MLVDATLDRLIMLLVLGIYYRIVEVIFWLLGRGDLMSQTPPPEIESNISTCIIINPKL
ncbi:hypothetical protein V6Z11_D09G203500 [Gossypium hirsutum]